MESNGVKGRVHISQDMAHLLALEGKSHWFMLRPDKITAKGKGEMTVRITYPITQVMLRPAFMQNSGGAK